MEGELHGCPLFEQIAVIKEVDLHSKWIPFCTSSMTIKDLDKLDTVGWFCLGLPHFGLARDGCFRAIACDNMMEDGQILVVGQGIQDRPKDVPYAEPFLQVEGLDIPDKPTRLGSGRMTIKGFSASINVISPTSASTTLIANINPNIPLIPQSLLDFVMRKLCGVVLFKLQVAAKKAANSPVKNVHARRMRQEEAFYHGWLLPKFMALCRTLYWDMPAVAAFNLNDLQLEEEFNWQETHRQDYKHNSFDEPNPGSPRDVPSQTESEPCIHSGDDISDDMSSVSGMTAGTLFSKNPFSNYLKEIEQKTAARKARKLEASRQRATRRLKPKAFNDVDKARLIELKRFKAQRSDTPNTQRDTSVIETSQQTVSLSSNSSVLDSALLSELHKHDRKTQVTIICSLALMMFALLYIDILFGVRTTLASNNHTFSISIAMDIGTLVYLVVCGSIHFTFCDVALVYAFDALEIGMKTGRHTKKFYDGTVRMVVAMASAGFITIGIVRALSAIAFRNAVWYTILACKHGTDFLASSNKSLYELPFSHFLPSSLLTIPVTLTSLTVEGASFVLNAIKWILFIFSWLLELLLVRSNSVGTFLTFLACKVFEIMPSPLNAFRKYVDYLHQVFENGETVISWRVHAVDISRHLLAYTAIFLLSILFLFTASAKAQKRHFQDSMDFNESFRFHQSAATLSISTTRVNRSLSRIETDDKQVNELKVDEAIKGTEVAKPVKETFTETSKKRERFLSKLRLRRKKKIGRSDQLMSEASF